MNPRTRSTIGALIMLAIVPILAGLLACMPVPIGNPERSRIDPDINGVWVLDDGGSSPSLYAFRPYDKRTWLITGTRIEAGRSVAREWSRPDSAEELIRLLENSSIGSHGITASKTVAYKAWLAKLGGVRFMTWEQVGGFDDEGSFTPEMWFVFKVVKVSVDRIELYMVNAEHDGFSHLVTPDDYEGDDYVRDMRRKWERALRKIDDEDEDLYADRLVLTRLPGEHLGKASRVFQEVIEYGF